MADVKISQLPVATTPVDGTEVLPIVQSATTKQVSIANLTAGRAMSASSLTLTTPLPVTSGGTGLAVGTSGGIPYFSSTTAITSSAALAANQLVIGGGAGSAPSTTTTGAGILTFLGTPSSANLAAAVTDETGTGALVFGTSPTFTTSLTTPLAIGGTTASSSLTLQSTSGVGTSDSILLKVGNNGATTAATVDTLGNVTLSTATLSPAQTAGGSMAMTGTLAMGSSFLRNRIINGDMRIDQRNAGAAVTSGYPVDRWRQDAATSAVFSYQQNKNSATPPTGFPNYLGAQVTTAYTPGANTTVLFAHLIEGFNVADLAWGSANAKTVTLSFWVQSSLTGTHSGAMVNSAGDRAYVYSYTINSANTWEYKTVTVAGDTTGTWLTNNGVGINLRFNLGTGTGTFGTTSTGWQAGNYVGLTTAVQVCATNGATFYITGVQLEVGSVATPFERRQYGTELMLCQRYFTSTTPVGTAAITATGGFWTMIETSEINRVLAPFMFPVQMRASPTMTTFSVSNAATGNWYNRSTGLNVTVSSLGVNSFGIIFNTLTNNQTAGNQILVGYTASAEL